MIEVKFKFTTKIIKIDLSALKQSFKVLQAMNKN